MLRNLIASTSTLVTNELSPSSPDNRDYAVAAKLFTYYLGSDGADEKTLFGNVLNHAAANAPVIGWVKDERQDVSYLSGSGQSHFLVTTNDHKNGSVWASFAAPASLSQPAPAGIKAANGTIYVAFGMSDGDNVSFMQNQIQSKFTLDQYLGAVPVGWTTNPSSFNFSPNLYSYFYKFLPQSNEMEAGPSGVGYELSETGTNMTTFATQSNQFMTALGMSSVNNWQYNLTDLTSFATTLNLPFVVSTVVSPTPTYTQLTSTAGTVIDGQELFYNATPALNISAVQNYVNAHWVSTASLFLNALADNATLAPTDMLYIADQLELDPNKKGEYVFLTPAEMGLTEANYYNSGSLSATSNVQAVSGTTLLASYPVNHMQNGSGLMRARMGAGWTLATTGNHEALVTSQMQYLGFVANLLSTSATTANSVIAQTTLTPTIATGWNHLSVNVAGTGTAKIGVYNGTAWTYSSTVTLTAAYQTLQLESTVPASGGLFQVILPAQTGAAKVYFINNSFAVVSWAMNGTSPIVPEVLDAPTNVTYSYTPSLIFNIPANVGSDQWAYNIVNVKPSTQYVYSVDVAGSGTVWMNAYGGQTTHNTGTITLGPQYQTLSNTITTDANVGITQMQVRASTQASPVTMYIRNASVTPVVPTNFSTGVETGQTQLAWTNTVDTTSPGGNENNVASAVLQLTTTEMSHGGGHAMQYGGTASGGTTNYALMEAFSNSTALTSTSRLSYWIFPQSPLGAEPNSSSTTVLNSTCVAIDIIFTNSTSLRGKTAITDQYGNQMHPAHMCNHLHPDQWNYVTSDFSSLSGLTVSRIDIGYDQPGSGAAGSYRGYVDDISLTH